METIILGDEHDDILRGTLRAVLISAGAVDIEHFWGVGGSQELEVVEVEFENERVTIEAETFVGLTLSGPKSVVENLAERVRQQLAS